MKLAAKALVIHNRKVLLMLRDNIPTIKSPNKWTLPGGESETGESFEETIKRELKEEINVVPRKLRYLGRVDIPRYNAGIFIGWLEDNEVKMLKLGDEGQELRFFSYDEIKIDKLAFNLRDYFLRYGKYINEVIDKDLEISPTKLGLS